MKVSEYVQFDAIGLAELIARRQVSAVEVQAAAQQAIANVEPGSMRWLNIGRTNLCQALLKVRCMACRF
ncbi:hypothetical protein [Pseudomonas sp. B21-035]|uniref:hypothetical protein n=1 Tax=Pseudomonas sp. B21-035 TaxID=2895484 RepID=UPI002852E3AA|nr:hypothetical protein [Pseudomonas sp. B21-035]